MTDQQIRRWMDASADFFGDALAQAGFTVETAKPELDRVTDAAGIMTDNPWEEMTEDHVRRLYVAVAKRTIELLDKQPAEMEAHNG